MPADPNAVHSDDRSRHCLTLTASAYLNGECSHVMRIARRRSIDLSPVRAIRRRARRRPRGRTQGLAPSISLLRIVAEGAGS
jgi:hypothetical protein